MLGQIFSTLGGLLGNQFGGGILSSIGRFAGNRLGTYLEQSMQEPEEFYRFHRHLDKLYLESDAAGKPIPLAFGRVKLPGRMIWALPIKEVANEKVEVHKFQGSDLPRSVVHDNSYTYYSTFALAICEGEITELGRVWAAGELMDLSQYSFALYRGTGAQMPDPLIAAAEGMGKTPAFRNLAYIVFENFPLADFGNRVPNFSFEILRKVHSQNDAEDLIEDIVVIPGSGEFVYDTIVQEKIIIQDEVRLLREPINRHNCAKVADAIFSLNQLQATCPNLKWVAPVVCWFGNSINAGDCRVIPKVEWNNPDTSTSEEWSVAGRNRSMAELVSRDADDAPNYGGSVNDASVLRYLNELRNRGLKTMFYPMFFLDIPGKPWRGRISGSAEDVAKFFNRPEGYKEFIMHYAHLVRGKVDAFVIGSELIGLTKIRAGEAFPAVHELIDLARRVKAVLGPEVLVTYAADWSEYHHTEGGWYNLDELWACEAIDFVGIDAYFPISSSTKPEASLQEIAAGWTSGEGWDHFRGGDGGEHNLEAPWAWKRIEWWWSNHHINPNGQRSPWAPKSKKIWFTEFGFPSIDKSPNQPNIFYDPQCVDGGVPRHSSGEVDLTVQYKSIKASLEALKGFEFLERKFLWTWDARPYPAWPHSRAWRDGRLWAHGHWVNGKLGCVKLEAVLQELCARGGIRPESTEYRGKEEYISGLVLGREGTILDAISMIRLVYFFDITTGSERLINFIAQSNPRADAQKISRGDLIKNDKGYFFEFQENSADDGLSKVMIKFIDQQSYAEISSYHNMELVSNKETQVLCIPITMPESQAAGLAEKIITGSRTENGLFKFILPISYMHLQPTDIVKLELNDVSVVIRITDVEVCGLLVKVEGCCVKH